MSMQCLLLLVLVAIYLVPHGSFMIFPTLGRSAHRVVVRMNKEGDGESKRFINPSFFERAKRGVVFSHELDKLFMPKKYDLDRILQPFSKGHAGFILSLENILLDLDALYHYAFMMLADELGYEVPSQTLVNDVIGLPFRDAVTSFAWDVPHNLLPTCEQFFFKVLENAFTSTPDKPPKIAINVRAGAVDLLDSMIRDGNEVAITSNLPRPLVTKLLTLTNLVMLFEGRVDPERLVTSLEDEMKPSLPPLELDELNGAAMGKERFEAEEDPFYEMDQLIDNFYTPTHGDRYQVQKYLKCCALMQKPPVLCLALESNRKNVISAKRAGINCVALKGNAVNQQFLRGADKLIASLEDFTVQEGYKIISKALSYAEGPQQQSMAAATPSKKVKTLTATPLMDKEDAPNTRGPVLRKPVVYTAADEDGVRGRGPVLPKPKALDSYDRGYTKNEESFDSKMNTDSWDDSMWAVEESELLQ